MNPNYVLGVGYVAQALADLLVNKNTGLAFTDLLKALGQFGVHTSITKAMELPPATNINLFCAETAL